MTVRVDPNAIVRGRNNGRSQLSGSPDATDWAHRLAAGRGGPVHYANGLWVTRAEHTASHAAPDLSRRYGWMVDSEVDPLIVPALCICQGMAGWFFLDELAIPATDDEVRAAGLDPDVTLAEALAELWAESGVHAPGVPA